MGNSAGDISLRELAARFYALDTAVYEATGSGLGKLYPGNQVTSEKQILDEMMDDDPDHAQIKQDLLLISNMIKTVEDEEKRDAFQKEYEDLERDVDESLGNEKALRERLAELFTDDSFGVRFTTEENHLVICIARECGSGGREIGMRLAKELGIAFYDTAYMKSLIDEMDDKMFGIRGKDAYFLKQSRVIENLAASTDCVMVGRCCGHVLMNKNIPRLSVFIAAPLSNRINRISMLNDYSRKQAEEYIRKTDKNRRNDYNYYTERLWGNPGDFDLCINTACYGIKGTVDFLKMHVQHQLTLLKEGGTD